MEPSRRGPGGLRGDEVQGKGLLNLDIGLPVAELRTVIRPCIAGSKKREGVILMMEED